MKPLLFVLLSLGLFGCHHTTKEQSAALQAMDETPQIKQVMSAEELMADFAHRL